MNITVSAPGKLMLLGEHAVVYGRPCIVAAVNERLSVTIEEIDEGKIIIDAPQVKDTRFVDAAIKTWGDGRGLRISTKSTFSGKYGLGSSSAVTVATLKALKPSVDNRTLFDAAYRIVFDIQGKGSGFDVAAAVYGGILYFVTGGKIIEQMKIDSLPLVVGYSGVKADTVTLIEQVVQKKKENPQKVERIFDAIAKLVEEAKANMLESDWERVGKLMDFNQEYLRDLGVSSDKLEQLISAAKSAGAYGAKLSGAGGGDCMICLVSEDKRKAVEKVIQEVGGEVVDITANAEGVRVEQ